MVSNQKQKLMEDRPVLVAERNGYHQFHGSF
jgi:hypothetical protein